MRRLRAAFRNAPDAPPSRRRAAAALAIAALALARAAATTATGAATAGSTLESTLVDQDGDGFLETGPGEPLTDRGETAKLGRTLATFGQLTDTHVRDEESPARVPFLDRTGAPFTSTFRPQEAFSTQTLDAAVRALNRQRPQAVFVTGDITDNAQRNELTMALRTLHGQRVDPDSGEPGYDGVQAADSADPFYYRPDHDAPTHPGALQQAQKPFKAEGLKAPWYPLAGNHDVLAQGEVPPTDAINAFATGDRLVPSLDPELRPPEDVDAEQAVAALLVGPVRARHHRRPRRPAAAHWAAPTTGSTSAPRPTSAKHVRAIMVDTVNRDGTSQARITPAQLAQLQAQLDRPATAGSSSSPTTR